MDSQRDDPDKLIGMREFRERFHELREPVKVVRTRGGMKVIGVFFPEPPKKLDAAGH